MREMCRCCAATRFLPQANGRDRVISDLERAIPAISQKMLIQQLRQMERDGIVRRFIHHQVPPKVEYSLTNWGQALCPALDAMLKWAALREVNVPPASPGVPEAGNGDAPGHD